MDISIVATTYSGPYVGAFTQDEMVWTQHIDAGAIIHSFESLENGFIIIKDRQAILKELPRQKKKKFELMLKKIQNPRNFSQDSDNEPEEETPNLRKRKKMKHCE